MDYIPIKEVDINLTGNGVRNCGNSCFFNSTNQMLVHIVEFREFMIFNKNVFSSNQILYSLAGLFEKIKRGKVEQTDELVPGITLDNFYNLVQIALKGDPSHTMEDASEVIESVYWTQLDNFFRSILNVSPTFGHKDLGN